MLSLPQIPEIPGASGNELRLLAQELMQSRRFVEARTLLQTVFAMGFGSKPALSMYCTCLDQTGQPDAAHSLQRALEGCDDTDLGALMDLARAQLSAV